MSGQITRQRLRQRIEVAANPRQAVHADDDFRVVALAPLGVGHRMQSGRIEALDGAEARFAAHLVAVVGEGRLAY